MSRKERSIMTTMNATDKQLELGFNGLPPRASRRTRRPHRPRQLVVRPDAAIVESAMDWSAAAEPRPEQIWIPGANREVKV